VRSAAGRGPYTARTFDRRVQAFRQAAAVAAGGGVLGHGGQGVVAVIAQVRQVVEQQGVLLGAGDRVVLAGALPDPCLLYTSDAADDM
jgi:hypothetical protein